MSDVFNGAPGEGEVWAVPCAFDERCLNLNKSKTALHPRALSIHSDHSSNELMGHETREVIGIISPANRRRYVIYVRRYVPEGRSAFGSNAPRIMTLTAFKAWKKGSVRKGLYPATLVQPSIVDRAIKILNAA